MTDNKQLTDDIRAAKYEALQEAKYAIDEIAWTEKGRRLEGLKAARKSVHELSKTYWSQAMKDSDNAAYRAAKDGGSAGSPAHVSSNMKPGKP